MDLPGRRNRIDFINGRIWGEGYMRTGGPGGRRRGDELERGGEGRGS